MTAPSPAAQSPPGASPVAPSLAIEEAALVGRREPYVRVTVVWAASPVSRAPVTPAW